MDRARWLVTIKRWRGFFGQRKGWLGEKTWDIQNVFFPNRKEAEAFIHTTGCDCCSRPPKKIVPNKWFSTGYADKVMYRPEPKGPKK